MSYHMIMPRKARIELVCQAGDLCIDGGMIDPGTVYTTETMRFSHESGKVYFKVRRWHHYCFFRASFAEQPGGIRRPRVRDDEERIKDLNRRSYLINQVLRCKDPIRGKRLSLELVELSGRLEVNLSKARHRLYRPEEVARKVNYFLGYVIEGIEGVVGVVGAPLGDPLTPPGESDD